jgi:hypothetical protein
MTSLELTGRLRRDPLRSLHGEDQQEEC